MAAPPAASAGSAAPRGRTPPPGQPVLRTLAAVEPPATAGAGCRGRPRARCSGAAAGEWATGVDACVGPPGVRSTGPPLIGASDEWNRSSNSSSRSPRQLLAALLLQSSGRTPRMGQDRPRHGRRHLVRDSSTSSASPRQHPSHRLISILNFAILENRVGEFLARCYHEWKLDLDFKAKLVELLREFPDCFAWEYHEMPGLDRSIVKHRLPIKPGFRLDLDRATPKDEYPMPIVESLIDAAAGHKMMSFLDGNAGYNQIFMAEEDVYKTAFRCPQGLFEFVVMTFGLKNAGVGVIYHRAPDGHRSCRPNRWAEWFPVLQAHVLT
ncbi:hypothetical protein U9M48_001230 [Paspalum notatum var. saurae]|uniref:Uncharacterized protein n=1 Tax=Paspalum notatum var. saurae TaxID=547442 RepID=A0AAQ3PJ33_PASNO